MVDFYVRTALVMFVLGALVNLVRGVPMTKVSFGQIVVNAIFWPMYFLGPAYYCLRDVVEWMTSKK